MGAEIEMEGHNIASAKSQEKLKKKDKEQILPEFPEDPSPAGSLPLAN
jgi:hypothetical protein